MCECKKNDKYQVSGSPGFMERTLPGKDYRGEGCQPGQKKTPTINKKKPHYHKASKSLSGLKRLSIILILPLFLLHHDHADHHDHDHHHHHHCHVSSGSLRSESKDVDAGKVAEVNGACHSHCNQSASSSPSSS